MLPADGKKPARAPDVVVAAQPAELVVTNGKPALQPVKGVNLLSVANADHALFVSAFREGRIGAVDAVR